MNRRDLVVATIVALGLTIAALPLAGGQAPYGPYQTDPIIAGGTDGTVWVTEVVGDQVWLGGTFSNVRNHAIVEEPDVYSQNLGVININTGLIVETMTFDIDGPVLAIELVDDVVWIGGDFTTVNGQTRTRLAAIDALSGDVLAPTTAANDTVNDFAHHDGWLYVGGTFDSIGGASHDSVARLDPGTGVVDAGWSVPDVSNHVEALDAYGDTIVVGNRRVSSRAYRISDPQGGNSVLGPDSRAWDVHFSPDGERVYIGASGNKAVSYLVSDIDFDNRSVDEEWRHTGAAGDAQAIAVTDTGFWYGFHEDFEGNRSLKMIKLDPITGELDESWYVEIDSFWGVYSIQATEYGLIAAGHFENVNGFEARRYALFPPVNPVDPAPPLRGDGDVNCDDRRSIVDALILAQYVTGTRTPSSCPLTDPATQISLRQGDVNADGHRSIVDALLVAQCAARLSNELCPD